MSHFANVKTAIVDKECLIKALKTVLGIDTIIEDHNRPVKLTGYYGNKVAQHANVVVRGSQLGLKADIGFIRNEDGNYDAVIDGWDLKHSQLEFDSPQDFLQKVQMTHTIAYIERNYPPSVWNYEQVTTKEGGIRLHLTAVSI